MKKSPGLIIAVVILIVVVIIAIHMTVRTVMPYSPAGPYVNQTPFEGFYAKPPRQHVSYSTYPDNVAIDQKVSHNIVSTASANTYQPLWGFGGLFGPPNTPDNNLDIYSTAPGGMTPQCANWSNGMSNSMGYLCLDTKQLQLLTTRGANQMGNVSQIGGY